MGDLVLSYHQAGASNACEQILISTWWQQDNWSVHHTTTCKFLAVHKAEKQWKFAKISYTYQFHTNFIPISICETNLFKFFFSKYSLNYLSAVIILCPTIRQVL